MDKICTRCKGTKPLDSFSIKKATGKPQSWCKACHAEKARAHMMRPPRYPAPEGMKYCKYCKKIKSIQAFTKCTITYDGRQLGCRPCMGKLQRNWKERNKDHYRKYMRNYLALSDRTHESNLKSRYGVPVGTYSRLLAEQDGKCAICGRTDNGRHRNKRLCLDHSHQTGEIRGLLCYHCNAGLGQFFHNISHLLAAVKYLQKYSITLKIVSK